MQPSLLSSIATGGVSQKDFFITQLSTIKNAIEESRERIPIVLGDFNLDENKKYRIDYAYRSYYESLDEHFDQLNLVQLVEFETWSRLVQGTWRSSILDHVYTNDGTVINELNAVDSVIGDHKILTFKLKESHEIPIEITRRDWRKYSKALLENELSKVSFNLEIKDVQALWNDMENILVKVSDKIIPLAKCSRNSTKESLKTPPVIKRKMNLRKKLIRKLRVEHDLVVKQRVKDLNTEIKHHFYELKRKSVRRNIVPENTK